ncbi:MAG: GNAT family N-acetyltransferase [Taibaiella sp.]|nr:GNAT family N-acetyltransferase [Taibaiella sp.]
MNWIQDPLILSGRKVELHPLAPKDFDTLKALAKDQKIWEYYGRDGADDVVMDYFLKEAMELKAAGQHYPFVVVNKDNGEIIGTTRYGDINEAHKTLEIGWTWYIPAVWGNGYNEECKLLMLSYAFETLGANRVQLKTAHFNKRSQRAIERIGATYEGTLRNHMINGDGSPRHTAMFSIIKEEWEDRKQKLQQMINDKYAAL